MHGAGLDRNVEAVVRCLKVNEQLRLKRKFEVGIHLIVTELEPERFPRGIRELKQPRRRRQQKPHKFAYLTMKNRIFARFARAFFTL